MRQTWADAGGIAGTFYKYHHGRPDISFRRLVPLSGKYGVELKLRVGTVSINHGDLLMKVFHRDPEMRM